MSDVISKAGLARELEVSRARISQLCRLGLPVRPDGKLNRTEAVSWVEANIVSCRNGSGGNLRHRPKYAGPQRALMPTASRGMESVPSDGSGLADLPTFEMEDWKGEIREQAVIDFINAVRHTANIENFARMSLRFGCSMQQAYAIAQWFDLVMVFYFVPKDLERDYIHVYKETDWNLIAAEANERADVQTWNDWMNRILQQDALN